MNTSTTMPSTDTNNHTVCTDSEGAGGLFYDVNDIFKDSYPSTISFRKCALYISLCFFPRNFKERKRGGLYLPV